MLLTFSAWAQVVQPGGTPPAIKEITFACEPKDAQVILEVGTAQPYLLGRANQKLPLDLSLFDGRRQIRLTFRREGWLDDTRVLQQENIRSRYFDDRDRYPDPQQGPVRLTVKGDMSSRLLQARYYGWQWRQGLLLSLLALAGLGGLGARRWLQLRRGHQRSQQMDRLTLQLDPNDAYSGRLLGHYRLLERLGQGGMSSVYRAVDNQDLTSEAAIKILDSELAQDATSVKRFQREIQICQSLSHPNILTLYDFGEQNGIFYLVMEKLEGETLATEIDKGVFTPARVAEVCGPMMEALSYLHQREVIHRDVKPDNVFVTRGGRVKLMDFGISRGKQFTVATATQMGLGTPAYMSPEQVEGAVHPATDQYAMGCMIYEMISGAPPFTDPDAFALAFKHVGQMPEPLIERARSVSESLNTVVMRLLEKDPERRYASMAEARAALLESCRS
jgi:tRNA A-37 threonylcarbamoyl transferase component Bud32